MLATHHAALTALVTAFVLGALALLPRDSLAVESVPLRMAIELSPAPAAVAAAAGLHVSRADGSPLIYNQENPYLPDLLICSKELAPKVLAALKASS